MFHPKVGSPCSCKKFGLHAQVQPSPPIMSSLPDVHSVHGVCAVQKCCMPCVFGGKQCLVLPVTGRREGRWQVSGCHCHCFWEVMDERLLNVLPRLPAMPADASLFDLVPTSAQSRQMRLTIKREIGKVSPRRSASPPMAACNQQPHTHTAPSGQEEWRRDRVPSFPASPWPPACLPAW